MLFHFWQNMMYVSDSSRMGYLDKISLKKLPPKIRILSDIVTHPTWHIRIYARKKQYFLVAPCIRICTHICTLRGMTTFRIITRTMTEYTSALWPGESRSHGMPRAIPSGVIPYETRDVHIKKYTPRSRVGGYSCAYIYPFPISPMSRVVFVSRRKVDARTSWQIFAAARRAIGIAPPGITSNVSVPLVSLRFVSGTGCSNLYASASLLVLRSLRDAYNAACQRRETSTTRSFGGRRFKNRIAGKENAPMALEIRPRDNGWSYKFNPTWRYNLPRVLAGYNSPLFRLLISLSLSAKNRRWRSKERWYILSSNSISIMNRLFIF